MYAIKGSWAGKTFAHAKISDSEGKKSRIRRSKEERKTMVEHFIKNYQVSNNGNFPSLNLTHKEVGGSFYTVREIVREIIQENRVLGPAKLTLEQLNTNRHPEEYILGTIAIEPPQIHLSDATSESKFKLKVTNTTSEDLSIISNGQCLEGNHVGDELISEELQMHEISETDTIFEEKIQASTKTASENWHDVTVETFPLNSVPEPIYSLNGVSVKHGKYSNGISKEEAKHAEVSTCSSLVDEKAISVTQEDQVPHASSQKNGIVHDIIEDVIDLEEASGDQVSTITHDHAIAYVQCNISTNGKLTNTNGLNIIQTTTGELISKEANLKESKVDVKPGNNSSHKASKPTLDRINLESWEGASKKSSSSNSNPVLAIFKSFVAAFVKFWSE